MQKRHEQQEALISERFPSNFRNLLNQIKQNAMMVETAAEAEDKT